MLFLLHFRVTDCYLHCSVFTVHDFTKTLVGCGVSYNNWAEWCYIK